MGISPMHNSRNLANGGRRIDATIKALRSSKGRRDFRHAAMAELSTTKQDLSTCCATAEFWSKFIKLSLMIVFYFLASVALTFYQKHLIEHIPLPISIVVFHLALKFCLSALCRAAYSFKTGEERIVLTWKKYFTNVAFAAVFSALDIGLSQWSFEYITISLYTMIKTTSIIFILMFAIFLKLEKKHWSQIVIVFFISVGLYLFTYRATSFDGIGFGLAFTASFLSGARWTFSQKVLQKSKLGLHNPIDFIYHIQPLMVLTILPLAVYVEGSRLVASEFGFRFSTFSDALLLVSKIGVGGVLAFLMEVGEFLIVTHASSLTLSIVGVIKEVVILALSIIVKGNHVSLVNVVGMIICLIGLSAHVGYKGHEECQQKKKNKARTRINIETSDSDEESFMASFDNRRSRGRSNFVSSKKSNVDSMPLLNDDDDDSTSDDEEFFQSIAADRQKVSPSKAASTLSTNNQPRRFDERRHQQQIDDSFYLTDQRQWTGVRDAHLEMRHFNSP